MADCMPRRGILCLSLVLFAAAGWGAAPARAEAFVGGTYDCVSVRVGKHISMCTSPPLRLYADGSYRIWNEQGTYEVLGSYIVLSETKKRGPGRIKPGDYLVFQYFSKGKRYEVTFRRKDLPPGLHAT